MKLALFTNIASHHQIPLGQALADLLPGEFSLVCWDASIPGLTKLGYRDDYEFEWLIKAWASEDEHRKAMELLHSADVVIFGYAPLSEINRRIENGKLTFRYTERPFKQGRWRLLDPRVLLDMWNTYRLSGRKNYHLLSVGPYCAADFQWLGAFNQRRWRWGYFPATASVVRLARQNSKPVLLWAGRMLAWKRVDLLLRAAAWVRSVKGAEFMVRIIGYGPEEKRLRLLVNQLGLADICEFESPKSPEIIGEIMGKTDIYVLPSDQTEGWGAVINEAMTHGCCVIGSKSAGAVPWLIQNGVNGYVFEDGGDAKDLGGLIWNCLNDRSMTQAMGAAARQTIADLWSPEVAAGRLLTLINKLQQGDTTPFQDAGPCSKA